MSQTSQQTTYLFEEAPIPQAVVKLGLPTVLSALVTLIYSLADTYFVGLLNMPVQTAAVSLAAPVLLAFNAVNNLFGVGSSSMMSRAMGRKDMLTLEQSSSFGFWCSLVCGLLFSLLCTIGMEPLLRLLGADSMTHEATARYLRWTVCLGAAPSILSVVMAYLVRAEGATLHASIGTMSGCLLNILLDPIFILPIGFGMGAEGAAVATLISNCFAMCYFFGYLVIRKKKTLVCISPKRFTFRREIVGGVCNVGVPASIQNLLNVASHMLLNNLVAPFGTAALAAMGIASKVSMIPWYIAMGISQGVMPLIGYTYAAGLIPRMKKVLRFTETLTVTMLFCFSAVMFLFASPLSHLFMDDADTVQYAAVFLRAIVWCLPFLAFDFLAVGVFQAVGKGKFSLIMAICRKVVFEIPAMFLLNLLFPLYGLAYAQLVAEIAAAAIGTWMLIRMVRRLEQQYLAGEKPKA